MDASKLSILYDGVMSLEDQRVCVCVPVLCERACSSVCECVSVCDSMPMSACGCAWVPVCACVHVCAPV
jgi:hypothetical protein